MITCRGRLPKAFARTLAARGYPPADAGAAGGAAHRGGGPRRPGVGGDRLGQDRGLRADAGAAADRGRGPDALGGGAAGARHRADAGARHAGAGPSSPGSSPAAGRGSAAAPAAATSAPSGRRWRRGSTSSWARRGGSASISGSGRSGPGHVACVVLDEADQMLGAGLPRRARGGAATRCREGRQTMMFSATVERRGRAAGAALPARRAAPRPRRGARVRAARRWRWRRADREAAVVNLLRLHEARAALVFCAPARGGRRAGRAAGGARLRGGGAVGRDEPGRAQRGAGGAARGAGAGLRRDRPRGARASTCRGSTWCCTPSCRGAPRCCCTGRGAPGGPGAAGAGGAGGDAAASGGGRRRWRSGRG